MTNYSLRVSNSNYGASFYGRTKIGNVTASANFNYSDAIDQGYNNSGTSILENLTNDNNRFQISDSRSKYDWNYLGGNFNLSWEPDTLNLFTVQGNIGKNNYNSYNITNMRLENIDRVRQWSLDRNSDSGARTYGWERTHRSNTHSENKGTI